MVRICPSCNGGQSIDLDDDAISVRSGKSTRSASSRKSSSGTQRSGTSGKASQSGRYGELPFDADGYCCRHPSVQIAQKKMIGGFKIIHDVCPDCAKEGSSSRTGRGRSRSKSRDSRRSRSRPRHRTEARDDASRSQASSKKKKRIRVKNLKTDDGNGRIGKYTGYVNDDVSRQLVLCCFLFILMYINLHSSLPLQHIPNGEGFITYDDGKVWEGEWAEGCQVNGKMRRSK